MSAARLRNQVGALVAAAMLTIVAAPAIAQSPPPPDEAQPQKKKHRNNVGEAIGAGILGGVVGGAIVGNQGRARPGYPPQDDGYEPRRLPPRTYDADADGYDEPACRMVRKPVYDEDGEVVSYRNRRVCR